MIGEVFPIETAPKDGTRILVCDESNWYVAAWGETNSGKGWVYAVVAIDWNYYEVVYSPIYWAPLPKIPRICNRID